MASVCGLMFCVGQFSDFVHSSPLRPLSSVASDYFSDSVVALEVLRPLRPLREIKIIAFCFPAKTAKSAAIYSLSYFTLALEWSQTSLRPLGRGPYSKKLLHLCLRFTGRKILVSSRLGSRMESAMNMSEQAHDNMSAPPRQNDGDDGCSKCTATPFVFNSITY